MVHRNGTVRAADRFALIQALSEGVGDLHPAYFAMVMATGIVATACHLLGMTLLGLVLTWLNVAAFAVLWIATLARIVLYPARMLSDLLDHNRGVGFFTVVAGTCVLGSQFVQILDRPHQAVVLWVAGMALWALLVYTVFAGFTVKQNKPSLAEGINGGWLVAVVATQSVSILGGLLVPQFPVYREPILFLSLSLWAFGGMLYIWLIALIFYRYVFFHFSASDLMPPYWINMGAMAISTLAGTVLIAGAEQSRFLTELLPFLKGLTILFWATATWWIPMLVILGAWRHLYKRFKLAYDPLYWGAVFPLGMYTACTFQLAEVTELEFLLLIPRWFVFIALAAWSATFIGLTHRLFDRFVYPLVAGGLKHPVFKKWTP